MRRFFSIVTALLFSIVGSQLSLSTNLQPTSEYFETTQNIFESLSINYTDTGAPLNSAILTIANSHNFDLVLLQVSLLSRSPDANVLNTFVQVALDEYTNSICRSSIYFKSIYCLMGVKHDTEKAEINCIRWENTKHQFV